MSEEEFEDDGQCILFPTPINETKNRITKTASFATADFYQSMTLNQNKLVAYILSIIDKDDDPADNSPYVINLYDLAKSIKYNSRDVVTAMLLAAKTMPNNELYFEDIDPVTGEGKAVRFPYFAEIETSKTNRGILKITFTPRMKEILIRMKRRYDIVYPFAAIAGSKYRYSPKLYELILSSITMGMYEQEGKYYKVILTPNYLKHKIGYKGRTSDFNKDVLYKSCVDINNNEASQIFIRNNAPDIETDGRKIVNYIFYVTVVGEFPFAIYQDDDLLQKIYNYKSVPTDEYLIKVMKTMGVEPGFIKYVNEQNLNMKTWKAILYTKLHGNNAPSYFNKTYKQNWADNISPENMIEDLEVDDKTLQSPIAMGFYFKNIKEVPQNTNTKIIKQMTIPAKYQKTQEKNVIIEERGDLTPSTYESYKIRRDFILSMMKEYEKNDEPVPQHLTDALNDCEEKMKSLK